MSEQTKEHFWIPESEVTSLQKKITSRPKPIKISYFEHGPKLNEDLEKIKDSTEENAEDNSLSDFEVMIFQVKLPEGEKIKDKMKIFDNNGLDVKVVKTEREAIVSAKKKTFEELSKRIKKYTKTGYRKTHYNFIESFKSYAGNEKDSKNLKELISNKEPSEVIDIQLMLMPNLKENEYKKAIEKINIKISATNKKAKPELYHLSDNTPVIRTEIPISDLSKYENDFAIYRIENTETFYIEPNSLKSIETLSSPLNPTINIDELPIVGVLDSGINFPDNLSTLIYDKWLPKESKGGNCIHGTSVASMVSFRYIGKQNNSGFLSPRARLVDLNIYDGSLKTNIVITRIQDAVKKYHSNVKIYNLSMNSDQPINEDEMSIFGYELDQLHLTYNVQFIVSAGNHHLFCELNTLNDILTNPASQISSPADSLLSIVVGAVVGKDYKESISSKNEIAPYSRRGPGFRGLFKPDISAYAGTIYKNGSEFYVPKDEYSLLLSTQGNLIPDAGTSFSAPIIAGDLAEIFNIVPTNNLLLAKALLYHAAQPLWDGNISEEELFNFHNIYGRGISNINDSIYSYPTKVTFLRYGSLNRKTKEHIKIYIPENICRKKGRDKAKISLTCLSSPKIHKDKGTEYVGAYIRASIKKAKNGNKLIPLDPEYNEGRKKWDICYQFSKKLTSIDPGDWEIWLELFSRWKDKEESVPYALVITLEDTKRELDLYSEIEAQNRYESLNQVKMRLRNQP